LQLLASQFNNPNKERIALLKVKDLGHQVRHLALKQRHLLHQAERSPSLIYSSFRLALQQRQLTLKIRIPQQVLNTTARRVGSRWNFRT
jgi:hypothetical protein